MNEHSVFFFFLIFKSTRLGLGWGGGGVFRSS